MKGSSFFLENKVSLPENALNLVGFYGLITHLSFPNFQQNHQQVPFSPSLLLSFLTCSNFSFKISTQLTLSINYFFTRKLPLYTLKCFVEAHSCLNVAPKAKKSVDPQFTLMLPCCNVVLIVSTPLAYYKLFDRTKQENKVRPATYTPYFLFFNALTSWTVWIEPPSSNGQ